MGRCGEVCFSRYVIRLTQDKPRAFGRLVGALIYGLFVGLVTLAHKGLLLYHYYTFLERHGIDPVPRAFLDGIPSYITPAYILLLLVIVPVILCACCGLGCKVRNLVHWSLAVVIGAIISSLLSYAAQIILYIVRFTNIYLDNKVFLVAMCYCAPRNGFYVNTTTTSLPTMTTMPESTTQEIMTSSQEMMMSTTYYDMTSDTSDVNITDFPFDASSDGFDAFYDDDVINVGDIWCQCEVPFVPYPVGLIADNPDQINAEYLRYFGVDDYTGAVNVTVVNSTQQVKDRVDLGLKEYKRFLSLLQGLVLVLAFRLPLWLIFSNLWSRVLLMETKVRLGLNKVDRISGQSSRSEFGGRLAGLVSRSGQHIKNERPPSRESSISYTPSLGGDGSDVTERRIHKAGVMDGIKKGQLLTRPPNTLSPILAPLLFCILETLDVFSLLQEILYIKHFFKDNTVVTITTLVLIGINISVTMITNVMVMMPDNVRGKCFHTIHFLLVFISNGGLLGLRVWLVVTLGAFNQSQISHVFFVFIGKEILVIVYEIIQYGISMSLVRDKDNRKQTAEMLGRWRNYTEGIQSDKMETVWIQMNGHTFGETADNASVTTDNTSVQSVGDRDDVHIDNSRHLNRRYQRRSEYSPFQRDFRYHDNDQWNHGRSYGVYPDSINLSQIQDDEGGFLGPEEIGGFGTFTRRSSRKYPPNIQDMSYTPQASVNRRSKYTEDELKNMVFYI